MSCFYFCFFLLIFVFKVLGSPSVKADVDDMACERVFMFPVPDFIAAGKGECCNGDDNDCFFQHGFNEIQSFPVQFNVRQVPVPWHGNQEPRL